MIAVVVKGVQNGHWFIPFEPGENNMKQCMYDGKDEIKRANEMAKQFRQKGSYAQVTVMEVLDCG